MSTLAPPLGGRLTRSLYFRPVRVPVTDEQWRVLETGSRFTVRDRGQPVACWSFGSGPTVVLVHGWNGTAGQLTPMVGPLVHAGFHVVAFDWPGHGRSAGSVSSLVHAGRTLATLQRVVGGIDGLVAHSFGGAAIINALARGLVVARRAVLVATVARLAPYVDGFSEALALSPRQKDGFLKASQELIGAPFAAFEPLALAGQLTVPALLVHSEEDRETPAEDARALAAAWPGARFELKRGLGHRRILADGDTIERTVSFLRAAA